MFRRLPAGLLRRLMAGFLSENESAESKNMTSSRPKLSFFDFFIVLLQKNRALMTIKAPVLLFFHADPAQVLGIFPWQILLRCPRRRFFSSTRCALPITVPKPLRRPLMQGLRGEVQTHEERYDKTRNTRWYELRRAPAEADGRYCHRAPLPAAFCADYAGLLSCREA